MKGLVHSGDYLIRLWWGWLVAGFLFTEHGVVSCLLCECVMVRVVGTLLEGIGCPVESGN